MGMGSRKDMDTAQARTFSQVSASALHGPKDFINPHP